jgi:hypothetical protein
MPHVHARTGRAGQGVDNVKICNVLARQDLLRAPRALSRRTDAIAPGKRQAVDFNGYALSRRTDAKIFQHPGGNTSAPAWSMLREVGGLAEQAFSMHSRTAGRTNTVLS